VTGQKWFFLLSSSQLSAPQVAQKCCFVLVQPRRCASGTLLFCVQRMVLCSLEKQSFAMGTLGSTRLMLHLLITIFRGAASTYLLSLAHFAPGWPCNVVPVAVRVSKEIYIDLPIILAFLGPECLFCFSRNPSIFLRPTMGTGRKA
jgi:hypothetical protein